MTLNLEVCKLPMSHWWSLQIFSISRCRVEVTTENIGFLKRFANIFAIYTSLLYKFKIDFEVYSWSLFPYIAINCKQFLSAMVNQGR